MVEHLDPEQAPVHFCSLLEKKVKKKFKNGSEFERDDDEVNELKIQDPVRGSVESGRRKAIRLEQNFDRVEKFESYDRPKGGNGQEHEEVEEVLEKRGASEELEQCAESTEGEGFQRVEGGERAFPLTLNEHFNFNEKTREDDKLLSKTSKNFVKEQAHFDWIQRAGDCD